jgi:[ribosomal protein S5]-alanine N-acetyltransferase
MMIETERLILREMLPTDDEALFEMDSNPEVHKYLGQNPVTDIEQVRSYIAAIRKQYVDHGIGRWTAVEKSSGNIVGWAGLKFITEVENNRTRFHDIGYRLNQKYWGKGYATESAKAALRYGFEMLQLAEIIGSANVNNTQSRRALEKCGLTFVEQFYWKDIHCDWLRITREEWLTKNR